MSMLASYHFVIITILVIITYIFSHFLVRKGRLSLTKHRKFWNYVLLLSFLISGLLGLLLALLIDWEISIFWYRELLWLHVEAGIIMAIISLIHIIWHWQYFKIKIKK